MKRGEGDLWRVAAAIAALVWALVWVALGSAGATEPAIQAPVTSTAAPCRPDVSVRECRLYRAWLAAETEVRVRDVTINELHQRLAARSSTISAEASAAAATESRSRDRLDLMGGVLLLGDGRPGVWLGLHFPIGWSL